MQDGDSLLFFYLVQWLTLVRRLGKFRHGGKRVVLDPGESERSNFFQFLGAGMAAGRCRPGQVENFQFWTEETRSFSYLKLKTQAKQETNEYISCNIALSLLFRISWLFATRSRPQYIKVVHKGALCPRRVTPTSVGVRNAPGAPRYFG